MFLKAGDSVRFGGVSFEFQPDQLPGTSRFCTNCGAALPPAAEECPRCTVSTRTDRILLPRAPAKRAIAGDQEASSIRRVLDSHWSPVAGFGNSEPYWPGRRLSLRSDRRRTRRNPYRRGCDSGEYAIAGGVLALIAGRWSIACWLAGKGRPPRRYCSHARAGIPPHRAMREGRLRDRGSCRVTCGEWHPGLAPPGRGRPIPTRSFRQK